MAEWSDNQFARQDRFHQSFFWLRPAQALFTIFRVLSHKLTLHLAGEVPASAGEVPRGDPPTPSGCPCPTELNPPRRLHRPHLSQRFHALLSSLFKVLFNFPLRYLSTICLVPVLSLRWSLPPTLGCIPKQPDSEKCPGLLPASHCPRADWTQAPDPGTQAPKRSSIRHMSPIRPSDGDSALGSSLFARRY
ncbi:hypothetical protein VZT92_026520 [Zoarces viviparus]|uniref:Uncharacterized protein n=1 Tax=Zoarces viviparus TaxID=48416 RepID=A0AAW1E1L4_ZOAVI